MIFLYACFIVSLVWRLKKTMTLGGKIVFCEYEIMHGIEMIAPCWVNTLSLDASIELKFNCQWMK